MNCVASTHDASGKLVGCTESELNAIISVQLYTVFAMSAGLYIYKSLTADNWADIAIQIGWSCVSAYTHTKRFATRRVLPMLCNTVSFFTSRVASVVALAPDTDSEVSVEDDHCYVRVVKDGTELYGCSSIFGLIHHLAEHVAEKDQNQEQAQSRVPRNSIDDSDDVVDVKLENTDKDNDDAPAAVEADAADAADAADEADAADAADESDESDEDDAESSDDEEYIKDKLARIENHGMSFDFVMCQVPTLQTATSDTPQCMYVMKYDGFPRTADGAYFCDRKFVPVDHRMMEVVLQYAGEEYELDLSSPDNFYVVGNNLLDPAFMKWFMRKNHGVLIDVTATYTIKCIDHNAAMHTMTPCNYLHVTETGFEVHDSGLV
jgi:hypothetical protein